MADNTLDHIVDDLRNSGSKYFPQHSEVKAVRVVGHTPKPDHYTYKSLSTSSTPASALTRTYRGKSGAKGPQELAGKEAQNLQFAHQTSEKRNLNGMPRPIGDFAELGAVVSTKVNGLPLQSIIMKAALLPDNGNHHLLESAARQAGEWLQQFHKATAGMPAAVDVEAVMAEFEKLCAKARKDGLPADSTEAILSNAKGALTGKEAAALVGASAGFHPVECIGRGTRNRVRDFANLKQQGPSLQDAAMFPAAVEVLEKYPFCNRDITSRVQDAFVEAYGVSGQEEALLDTLKMKILLQMFAQGRLI